MKIRFVKLFLAVLFVAATLAVPKFALAQGITTGAVNGTVTDAQGKPLSGAGVVILHEPSGTRATGVTRGNGQFNISGLRVGGPYTITVESRDFQPGVRNDIYLDAGTSTDVSIQLTTDVVKLEAMEVSAGRDATFGAGKMGIASAFDAAAVENATSVRRNIQDVAVLDSRLFLGSLDQGGQLSAQGQNFRYNSLLVDGVRSDDQFGLNSNGFSSLRSPVPLDAIQSMSVELNPYSGRYAGFTGAVINTTIISGTNEFHGRVYYETSAEGLRAKNPVSGIKEPFDEKSYGLLLNGPILRNKLFFSFVYDKFKRTTTPPQATFIPNAAVLDTIVARAKALGYDTGGLAADNVSNQETYIGKLDWNISEAHRLSLTYRRNYGEEAIFPNYTSSTTTSLSNYWYQQPRNTDSYVAQLNSQWSPDFRTEVTGSYTKFDGSPKNGGAAFPQVLINGVSGTRSSDGAALTGGVYIGTESSRQLNQIITKETQGKFLGEWSRGDHTLTFGVEDISTKYNNAFIQYTNGNYTFSTPATWIAGTPPSGFTLAKPYAGSSIEDAIARWKYDAYGAFIEDTWRPNSQLTLLAGLRLDYPYIGEKPPVATGFEASFGAPNNTTNSGNYTAAPRFGFSYEFKTARKTQLRGGVGLFQGKNPAVWISNAYSNAGSVYSYSASGSELPLITFNPDPNTQTVPGVANPAPNINVTSPNFKQPSLWKSNIAIDRELPFGGIIFTADYYYNIVESGVQTLFLNYREAGAMPDGRVRYAGAATPTGTFAVAGITSLAQAQAAFGTAATGYSATTGAVSFAGASTNGRRRVSTFADVFYLTNTGKGEGWGTTLSLRRPVKKGWGWSASWTHGNATEVSPITSSTASSNYQNRAVYNPNENVASRSNTSIPDRIVVSLTKEFKFIQDAPTRVSVVYQGRSGHPYSWVFGGDANGDGYSFNDLLYVPTGKDDPKVIWASTAERDAFFAFVDSSSLSKYKGTHAPRNSETSPWLNTVDLKFTQAIPLYKRVKAELYVNVLNFANFLNSKWGIQEEVPFSYRRGVARASYNIASNQWVYTFNSTTFETVPTTVNDTPVSRYQVLAGMRIKF